MLTVVCLLTPFVDTCIFVCPCVCLCMCISGDITSENVRSKSLQGEMDSMINDLQNVLWLPCVCLSFDCLSDVSRVNASIFIHSLNFYPHYYYYYYHHPYNYCYRFILYVSTLIIRCFLSSWVRMWIDWLRWRVALKRPIPTTIISLPRRITCRKGKVQGCQRRTRHDIERIVGLLNQSLLSVTVTTMSCSLPSNISSCSLSFVYDSFYLLYVNLYVRSSGSRK